MRVPQLTERLRDAENESMAKIAELEKQLSHARKELDTLRVRLRVMPTSGGHPSTTTPPHPHTDGHFQARPFPPAWREHRGLCARTSGAH